jgi:hypothetical protein
MAAERTWLALVVAIRSTSPEVDRTEPRRFQPSPRPVQRTVLTKPDALTAPQLRQSLETIAVASDQHNVPKR